MWTEVYYRHEHYIRLLNGEEFCFSVDHSFDTLTLMSSPFIVDNKIT